jgi:hypothetical protein
MLLLAPRHLFVLPGLTFAHARRGRSAGAATRVA